MAGSRDEPRQQRSIATREALLLGAARVFAHMPYSQARLRDISQASRISEGALYFHFGTKAQIAEAVLSAQQDRMTSTLAGTLTGPQNGLQKLFTVMSDLAALMASDEVVQAGIKLANEPSPDLASAAHDPYFEWIGIARSLLEDGVADGSVTSDLDVSSAAEFLNYAFVGAQTLAGMADRWKSLPERMLSVQRYVEPLLSGQVSTTAP
ncbi:TetR family transcriptional regulator [Microbacterium sp. P04]|uniref:TetR family transcriptional regulator n=1 Tax=Microbacterium sp. P04 TaxID=3366947 RepID=UPI0037456B42